MTGAWLAHRLPVMASKPTPAMGGRNVPEVRAAPAWRQERGTWGGCPSGLGSNLAPALIENCQARVRNRRTLPSSDMASMNRCGRVASFSKTIWAPLIETSRRVHPAISLPSIPKIIPEFENAWRIFLRCSALMKHRTRFKLIWRYAGCRKTRVRHS
jgi:hypothetical protein